MSIRDPKNPASHAVRPPQDLEELKRRFTALNTRRIQAETNLKNANEQMETLKRQALEAYGTDDLEELKKKLDGMKRENERKRAEYQQHLDEIDARLSEVERQYQQVRSTNGG